MAADTVIITGSSGYIGSAIVKKLAGQFRLVGFDKIAGHTPPPAAECVCIDLTSEEAIAAAFERVRIAYGERIASVIHLAAYYDLSGEPNPLYERITIQGTARLMEQLKHFQVEQFIFSSTMLVHAPADPGQRINEDSPVDPRWPYPQSKLETEALIHKEHGDIPVALLRLAGVYDDGGHSAFLSQQIARIYERQLLSHIYPGAVSHGQASIHLDDVAEAFAALIHRRRELPKELTLLLGEDETLGYGEVQRIVGRILHAEEWETREIPKPLARTGAWLEDEVLDEEPFIKPWMVDFADDHYELDISRARQLLHWEPRHSLKESLPKIVAELKADPVGWYRTNKLNAARVADRVSTANADVLVDPIEHRKMMREHAQEMRQMHYGMIWVHFLNILLGVWLVTAPFILGSYGHEAFPDAVLRVTHDRGLWDPAVRNSALVWSDVVSGALIMLFGALSLSPRLAWAQWANTLVGIWLLFAPLLFWSPSAAVYANDTLVGALVIAFAILIPMMPGMSHEGMMDETDVPVGWSYCPSTYLQRLPIIALGAVGFFIARYLAAYQMGHVDHIIDPFFAGNSGLNGTATIITSDVSKAWPIPDAGLGAVTYMFEILMGVMGDRRRWRTMPWMVTMFIIVVVPLGAVSIYFIIIQPIVIGTYCSLCLLAALAMVLMIPYSLDELIAMGQYLVQCHRRGQALVPIFFMGGASPGSGKDKKPDFGGSWPGMVSSALRGVTVPWTLIASALLGIWLMFSRLVFGSVPSLADSDHLVGALVFTVAVIAMAEVARSLRFLNVLLGAWLVAAPWLLSGGTVGSTWNDVLVGILVIAASFPRGKRSAEHYGAWDRFVV